MKKEATEKKYRNAGLQGVIITRPGGVQITIAPGQVVALDDVCAESVRVSGTVTLEEVVDDG